MNAARWRTGGRAVRRTTAGWAVLIGGLVSFAIAVSPAAAQGPGPASSGLQTPTSYAITLVTSDTGRHILAEVETGWRLRTVDPVELILGAPLRVVRVLVDGKPNTRLSRTMYARQDSLIVVPHEKAPGDTLTTRVRYHGIPDGGAVVEADPAGRRVLVAQSAAGAASRWLPVPAGLVPTAAPRVSVTWQVQASGDQRVIANGVLTGIDTLNYGHTTWHYRLDRPVPLTALAAAVGRFAVAPAQRSGCRGACPPVTVWTSPEDSSAAAGGPLGHAGEILAWLASRLGPFPYPALAHVVTTGVLGAANGASVVLYQASQLRGGNMTEADVVRGTAGQWLGLAISDSSASGPVAATADYLAWLWTRERRPGPNAQMLTRQLDAIRALHQTLGDSSFYRGLRRLLERHRDTTVPAATFTEAMTEAAGKQVPWSWPAAPTR